MNANQYVLAHGMRRTRSVLTSWGEDPWPVITSWMIGAFLISVGLLVMLNLFAGWRSRHVRT